MQDVIQFYTLSYTFISLIGAVLLLMIYSNIRTRFSQLLEEEGATKRVDRGLLYLSLALFVWVFSGLWNYLSNKLGFFGGFEYQIGIYLLSIVNNMFFLLALFYFHYAPGFIYKNSKNVKLIIAIIIIVTLSTFLLSSYGGNLDYQGIRLYAIPDLLLSGFLSFLLMVSLYRTFMQRSLQLVAYISVLVIVLMFISQLPEVFQALNTDYTPILIKLISKTALIFIFMVLATSWVIQLANTPKANEIKIRFLEWSIIELSIPSKNMNAVLIDFGSKMTQYKNLLKFATRRKLSTGEEQSILVGGMGEIKNQAYLTRIIDNINVIAGNGDTQKLERIDLFTFLGSGKYRLRMLPKNIEINEELLDNTSTI